MLVKHRPKMLIALSFWEQTANWESSSVSFSQWRTSMNDLYKFDDWSKFSTNSPRFIFSVLNLYIQNDINPNENKQDTFVCSTPNRFEAISVYFYYKWICTLTTMIIEYSHWKLNICLVLIHFFVMRKWMKMNKIYTNKHKSCMQTISWTEVDLNDFTREWLQWSEYNMLSLHFTKVLFTHWKISDKWISSIWSLASNVLPLPKSVQLAHCIGIELLQLRYRSWLFK